MDEDKAPESVWRRSWWRRSARRLWRTPDETDDPGGRPLGLWLTDDTVVVARVDGVRAFGTATGEPLWTWQPPGGQIVGLVSADAQGSEGVVMHYEESRRDVRRVGLTTLAVATGEVVRRRKQDAAPLGHLPPRWRSAGACSRRPASPGRTGRHGR
ncbi:hypothetical protein N7U49_23095 [Streptomyces sp. AD2-2]|nr:hypothetical protein N7U49_23095 [Streptomyces sp. AD2-2]